MPAPPGAACDGAFIRVNVHPGVRLTDQGRIKSDAFSTVRDHDCFCPGAEIFADVHVYLVSCALIPSAVRSMISRNEVFGRKPVIRSNFSTTGLRRRMSSKPGA